MRQTSFGFTKDYRKDFGGSLNSGKRKEKRPLSTKHPIHLILKACERNVFLPGNRGLEKLIHQTAHEFQIRLYDLALNWSHVHFLIRISSRDNYVKFIRALTSRLAHKLKITGLFQLRPFTRIVSWGRDFKNVLHYTVMNQMEGRGIFNRKGQGSRAEQRSNHGSGSVHSQKKKPPPA